MLRLGHAFFTPANDEAGIRRHLWFVLSAPTEQAVVIANLSTLRPANEHLGCTVNAREHPSIAHASVLRCDQARLQDAIKIETLLARHTIQETTDASPELVRRLQASLCGSPDTPNEAKAVLLEQGFCGDREAREGGG